MATCSGTACAWSRAASVSVCALVLVVVVVIPGAALGSSLDAALLLRTSEITQDLQCWDCQGSPDSPCGDEKFTGLNNADVKKRNCSQTKARLGLDERTSPATFCSKGEATSGGKISLVFRGCMSPGEFNLTSAGQATESEGCQTRQIGKGGHTSLTVCLCKGDFCNGSRQTKMALSNELGLIFLAGLLLKAAAATVEIVL